MVISVELVSTATSNTVFLAHPLSAIFQWAVDHSIVHGVIYADPQILISIILHV